MKRKLILYLTTVCMALTVISCGSSGQEELVASSAQEEGSKDNTEDEEQKTAVDEKTDEEETSDKATIDDTKDSEVAEPADTDTADEHIAENTESVVQNGEFSFQELQNLDFWFSSGAGGWATILQIHPDGSFEGQYHDSEMGSMGEGYPNGTMYQANFNGQFTQPVKVNDYTYSMQIETIHYEQEIGTEEIKDDMLYIYTDAYGLEEAENILIYLPGTPLSELSEEFLSWVGYYDLSATTDTGLPFYALNNEVKEEGFVGNDIVANVKETFQSTEQYTAILEQSVNNDPLSQAELNEKSQYMYEEWDHMLNELWRVLKRTLDADRMNELTEEQRAWIAEKEQAVAEAGAEFEGGSMQPMAENLRAAELTKERVNELMEYLE